MLESNHEYWELFQEVRAAYEAEAVASNKPVLLLSASVASTPDRIKPGYDIPVITKYPIFYFIFHFVFLCIISSEIRQELLVFNIYVDSKC